MVSKKKLQKLESPAIKSQRDAIESRLKSIPSLDSRAIQLMTDDGFFDYFLQMRDLYSTYEEAYERLEDFYVIVTGHRHYSEFRSMMRALRRYLHKIRHD